MPLIFVCQPYVHGGYVIPNRCELVRVNPEKKTIKKFDDLLHRGCPAVQNAERKPQCVSNAQDVRITSVQPVSK